MSSARTYGLLETTMQLLESCRTPKPGGSRLVDIEQRILQKKQVDQEEEAEDAETAQTEELSAGFLLPSPGRVVESFDEVLDVKRTPP